MRFPLALKVSLWLLLNLLVLVALGGFWLFRPAGSRATGWGALADGPSGRVLQAFAEVQVGELHGLPRSTWTEQLARVSAAEGVQLSLYGENLRHLGGARPELPAPLVEWLKQNRPPPPPGAFGEPFGPDDAGAPAAARPAPRDPRHLVRAGEPAEFWLAVQLGGGGRPREFLVVRVPGVWRLLDFLGIDRWLLGAGAAILCSILLWLPVVGALTRAIRRLERATHAIADGRFDTRVPEDRRDELGALGVSINRMSARLERLVTGQKRFLGDVAHELGSPLGRMQMGVGILEERAPAALQGAVADVREEVGHMGELVAELLAFTRAGLVPRDAARARVELAPLVERMLVREAATDAVLLELEPDLAVRADAPLLARALGNLVRNALRYAGREHPVTLRARRVDGGEGGEGGEVEIVVEDEGPGVPPDALERLGEPFFRPESARQRETGGTGLGLAIVRGCAEACGGSVRFANRNPRGFAATLRLRAAK